MAWKRSSASQRKDPLPSSVQEAEEEGKVLPQDYFVQSLRERRQIFALRALSIGLILMTFLALALAMIIVALLPLKEVRPFLVRVMDEGSVVADVRPIQDTFEAQELLTEKLVREYVLSRHEILRSNDVMRARWSATGQVAMMSTFEEYRRFNAAVAPLLENIRREDGEALVTIMSVVPITSGRSYVVDFRLTTYDRDNRVVQDAVYTATMEIEYRQLTGMSREQLLINPTGFTVIAYSLAEKTQ